jgi:hypothetical protein
MGDEQMKKRTVLLGVAVLAIGFMVLPYAMSGYVPGSHDWEYDGTWDSTNDVDCARCHAGAGAGGPGTAYHQTLGCQDCHIRAAPTGTNHTAIEIPTCTQGGCHSTVATNFTNNPTTEPHYEMYLNATTDDTHSKTGTANEACISCHTGVNVAVDLNWTETASTIIYINATGGASGWIEVTYE